MKRLVREVITLLRIERWLLDEGTSKTEEGRAATPDALTTLEQSDLLPAGLTDAELAALLATCQPPAGTRVLTQRVIQVIQQDSNES